MPPDGQSQGRLHLAWLSGFLVGGHAPAPFISYSPRKEQMAESGWIHTGFVTERPLGEALWSFGKTDQE